MANPEMRHKIDAPRSYRIESVDAIRVIAILAVIIIHTVPLGTAESDIGKAISAIINQLARFAVPFFFVISGYFWAVKVRQGASFSTTTEKMLKRLGFLFLAWSLIYLLPYNVATIYEYGLSGPIKASYWVLHRLLSDPFIFLFQGSKVHLWFLMGLMCALAMTSFFIYRRWINSLFVIVILLYVLGIIAKAYANTPIGIHIKFDTLYGPFFGGIFFVTGYVLSQFKPNSRWLFLGLAIWLAGCLLHLTEIYVLWKYFNTAPKQDYVFGTYFMGTGAAMVALSNHHIFNKISLHRIGGLTLGIYACHFIFVDILKPVGMCISSNIWDVLYPASVFTLSTVTAFLLSKNSRTRPLVM